MSFIMGGMELSLAALPYILCTHCSCVHNWCFSHSVDSPVANSADVNTFCMLKENNYIPCLCQLPKAPFYLSMKNMLSCCTPEECKWF